MSRSPTPATLRGRAWTAGLVVVACAAAASAAASSPGSPDAPDHEERLTVEGRSIDSPGTAVTILDRAAIEAANVRTVAELVRYVAGVQALSSGSRGGLTTVLLRGGDPNFTLVLVDGVPLNNPTDVVGGAFNLSSLGVAHVERVEVVRGPLSYFYGANGLAGSINIVTRRGSGPAPRVSATVEAGDASLVRANAGVGAGSGGLDWYVGAGAEDEEGRLGDDSFTQRDLQGSLGLAVGERGTLRLTTRASRWEADDYPDASGGPVFGSGELRHSENAEYSLGAVLSLPAETRWSRHAFASYVRQDVDRESPAVGFEVPASIEEIAYSRLRAGVLAAFFTGADGSGSSRIQGGVDIEVEDAENESLLLLPPAFGGPVAGDYDRSRTTPGAFAEAVLERGRLTLQLGMRADFPENEGTELSPRLGARYALDGGTILRGTVSRAFKLPSFFALASPPALGGNPDLRPETSWGADLGIERRFDPAGVTIACGAFFLRFDDLVDFDFPSFRHVNRTEGIESTGLEASLSWTVRERLRLSADATWQDVEDRATSRTPLHRPDWWASARLVWEPLDALLLSLEGRSVARSLDTQLTAPPGRDSVAGYTVFDLAATWRLAARWELRARLENLTDRDYEHFIGFTEPGFSGRVGLRFRSSEAR